MTKELANLCVWVTDDEEGLERIVTFQNGDRSPEILIYPTPEMALAKLHLAAQASATTGNPVRLVHFHRHCILSEGIGKEIDDETPAPAAPRGPRWLRKTKKWANAFAIKRLPKRFSDWLVSRKVSALFPATKQRPKIETFLRRIALLATLMQISSAYIAGSYIASAVTWWKHDHLMTYAQALVASAWFGFFIFASLWPIMKIRSPSKE